MSAADVARSGASGNAAPAEAVRPALADASSDLPPMVGQRVDDEHVVLYRTVVRSGRAYRQGVLLDVPVLATWLRAEALGDGALAPYAVVAIGRDDAALPADSDAWRFQHRFAEPFAALAARLVLRPLPGTDGARYVYALAALLATAVGVGLLALYRMVAVRVRFAERRSNFVAAVSHELKTPLTAIRMYGEMLRDGIVASEAKRDEYYRHITAESERLSRLINNVLEFARLEKGTRSMAVAVSPVRPVIEEAAALLRPHVEHAGFRLQVEVAPDLPAARFERDALLQILFNVVDNAVKYAAGATDKDIVLRAWASDGRAMLAVRDHGPGVPAAHLRHVFEPFYRGEHELTRQTKGTGLGLALVRGLVDGMGAAVVGRNHRDGGFEVEIALAPACVNAPRR